MDFKEQQERRKTKKRKAVEALIVENKAKYDKLSDSDKAKTKFSSISHVADCS